MTDARCNPASDTETVTLDSDAANLPAINITTPIATDGIVNDAEDNALIISGTTTNVEDGRTVTVTFSDGVNPDVTATATVTAGAWSISYQVPVGAEGLRIGTAYSHNHYQLGREFKSLDAYGSSETASLFASYPLYLSQTSTLFGALSYENKKLHDRMDNVLTNNEKQVQLVSVGLSGEHHDMLNGGGRTTLDASL